MNLTSMITDNISELLVKIVEFTQKRQKLLTDNINNTHTKNFIPRDLPIEEFSDLLNVAIDEHTQNHRLLLLDTDNIKFGASGHFETKAVIDEYAKELHKTSLDEYIELQINKLLENSLNQRVAAELIKQKQGVYSASE